MSRTCVFLHAHPDDEALLTGGTMAGLAAQGHRVVLVVATAGENGLSGTAVASRLGQLRSTELDASAALLGCARVHHLGYAISGLDRSAPPSGGPPPFAQVPVSGGAAALAEILRDGRADLVTSCDAAGGYGHLIPAGPSRSRRAARLAGTRCGGATVDRALLLRALRLVSAVYPSLQADARALARLPPLRRLPSRINVRPWAQAKRAALSAHASQTTGSDTVGRSRRCQRCRCRVPSRPERRVVHRRTPPGKAGRMSWASPREARRAAVTAEVGPAGRDVQRRRRVALCCRWSRAAAAAVVWDAGRQWCRLGSGARRACRAAGPAAAHARGIVAGGLWAWLRSDRLAAGPAQLEGSPQHCGRRDQRPSTVRRSGVAVLYA